MNLTEAVKAVNLAQAFFDADPCRDTLDALDAAMSVFEQVDNAGGIAYTQTERP
jgi:hypothetical protein